MDSVLETLVHALEEQRRRLDQVQAVMADRGRLASAIGVERIMMRLQMLADRLALLPPITSSQVESLDRQLKDQVNQVVRRIGLLAIAAEREERLGPLVDDLLDALEQVNALISRRRDLVVGQTGSTADDGE